MTEPLPSPPTPPRADLIRWSGLDPDYTPAQLEYLRAVDAYAKKHRRRFLHAVEYLAIAESLGYRRGSA